MYRLTCPHAALTELARQAAGHQRGAAPRWPLTVVMHAPGDCELLLRQPGGIDELSSGHWLSVRWVQELPFEAEDPEPGEAVLWFSSRGAWCGLYRPSHVIGIRWPAVPIDEIMIPGPGLHRVQSDALLRAPRQTGGERGSAVGWWLIADTHRDDQGPFSRTAGALGGWPVVERLRTKKFGLVGAGRTGALLAMLLTSLSPWCIWIIDPDDVEPGNEDAPFARAMRRRGGSRGARRKVHQLVEQLAPLAPQTRFIPIANSVLAPAALRALADCDVILSAVDNDLARLACSAIASAYHRVHLDLGSLVTQTSAGGRLLGADCRLILPGRCLCCYGAFAQADRLEGFALDRVDAASTADWRGQKTGALTSWSAVVAGLGIRMIEDLAAERLANSTWVRMTQPHAASAPRIEQLTAEPDRWCPVCAQSGMGSDVLHRGIRTLAGAVVVRMKRRSEVTDLRSS